MFFSLFFFIYLYLLWFSYGGFDHYGPYVCAVDKHLIELVHVRFGLHMAFVIGVLMGVCFAEEWTKTFSVAVSIAGAVHVL